MAGVYRIERYIALNSYRRRRIIPGIRAGNPRDVYATIN